MVLKDCVRQSSFFTEFLVKNVQEPLEMGKATVTSLNTFLVKFYFEMCLYTFAY